jgi:histidinol-phosphate aminotransferase
MIDNLLRDTIKPFVNYVAAEQDADVIINANESAEDLFKRHCFEEFKRRIEEVNFNRYPDSDSVQLCDKMAQNLQIQRDEIIAGVGCDEIIRYLIDAFIDKGEVTAGLNPTFSMYEVFTTIAGGVYKKFDCDENFIPNLDELITFVRQNDIKMLFLCNPNNPTGFAFTREQLLQIIENTNCIVVIDEVYSDFSDFNCLNLYRSCERVIVLRTMSKAYSLAGIRIGFAIAQKATIDCIKKVKVPYNLNILSQIAGELILEYDGAIRHLANQVMQRRDEILSYLSVYKGIRTYPSQANFLLLHFDKFESLLAEAKHRSIALKTYSEGILANHIRLSIGTQEEMKRFLEIVNEVYQK